MEIEIRDYTFINTFNGKHFKVISMGESSLNLVDSEMRSVRINYEELGELFELVPDKSIVNESKLKSMESVDYLAVDKASGLVFNITSFDSNFISLTHPMGEVFKVSYKGFNVLYTLHKIEVNEGGLDQLTVESSPQSITLPNSEMRTFDTGASRNLEEGKLDFEGFLSPLALKAYAEYMNRNRTMANGQTRDSDNWQKGMPKDVYMKSMYRHFFDVWSNHRGIETDEDMNTNLCAVLFNAMGLLHENLKEARKS